MSRVTVHWKFLLLPILFSYLHIYKSVFLKHILYATILKHHLLTFSYWTHKCGLNLFCAQIWMDFKNHATSLLQNPMSKLCNLSIKKDYPRHDSMPKNFLTACQKTSWQHAKTVLTDNSHGWKCCFYRVRTFF